VTVASGLISSNRVFWTVTHLSDTLAERRRIGKRYRVSLSISVGAVCYQGPVLDDAASPN
jgi:hypothetical protein